MAVFNSLFLCLFYFVFAEYANQQRHEGGTFYSIDIVDSARIHYRNSWIPILHAAALWLNSGGFDESMSDDSPEQINSNDTLNNSTPSDVRNSEEINADRFHLIFGMQFLLKFFSF